MAKDFYNLSAGDCLKALQTSKDGLSSRNREMLLKQNGLNELKSAPKPSSIKLFLKQFKDVMTIVLLVAASISMMTSAFSHATSELVDGFIILGIVFFNAFIGFWQEQKAQKSMEELKKLTQPEAKVVSGGIVQKISSKNIVLGDILVLEAGDIVPADARLIESVALKCDESALTGESVATLKDHKAILPHGASLADRVNMVFSGSIVTSGRGLAVCTATGQSTEIGKIAKMLAEETQKLTPLQQGIKALAKFTTYIVLFICLITFFIELFVNPTSPLDAFLTAVALAVAAIPESLPAVITIIISLGTFRLAKKKVIIKHLNAIETLGCCQIICSDKTGTLTQNKMVVESVFSGGKLCKENIFKTSLHEHQKLLEIMFLCESVEEGPNGLIGDPTELALVNFAEKVSGKKRKDFCKVYEFVDEIPFDSNRKKMTSIYYKNGFVQVLSKGAVDEILKSCTHIEIGGEVKPLLPTHKEKILRANKEMAQNALRVLGFAYKTYQSKIPISKTEENLVFVGLCGMFDPPRKEAKKAVEKCKRAGVRPIMITGDHKTTAFAIAKTIGITDRFDEVLTGAEIDKLDDAEFKKTICKMRVFARVSPENKVRIVETFKSLGRVVAMTGDGVNDAPSIKKADIGIGMGQDGTDVTKEAADMIITDDNFATIVVGIEEGRKTFANIKKTIQFLFTANLAEITAIFLATIFMPSLVFLTPVQILFVNLISDTLPAIALGVEPAEENLMHQKPRSAKKSLLSGGVGVNILVMGVVQGLIMLSCFFVGLYGYQNEQIASTMAFYALNIVQFCYFISMRTNGSIFKNPITNNRLAVWAVAACFLFVAVVAITPLSGCLGLVAIPFGAWLFIGFASALMFVISEILKFVKRS